jgi:hypothetical protein
VVDDHAGIAQTDLGRRLQMDRAATNTLVNRHWFNSRFTPLEVKQLIAQLARIHE